MTGARSIVARVLGTEVVNGDRLFVISYRRGGWIKLGDRFLKLRRVSESLALPERCWSRVDVKEVDVDLTVERYEGQSQPGHACVRFVGQGMSLLRPPSRLEDWQLYQELLTE
jgi:hypothetical protein